MCTIIVPDIGVFGASYCLVCYECVNGPGFKAGLNKQTQFFHFENNWI